MEPSPKITWVDQLQQLTCGICGSLCGKDNGAEQWLGCGNVLVSVLACLLGLY
jgi:hypothetical protein